MSEIVLIDDDARLLDGLHAAVQARLPDVSIARWQPGSEDDVEVAFRERVDDGETVLVATDQDLTAGGLRGFFGATIVRWCQQLAIPVGDFSRRTPQPFPRDADLFELRIPPNDEDGAELHRQRRTTGSQSLRPRFRHWIWTLARPALPSTSRTQFNDPTSSRTSLSIWLALGTAERP